MDREPPRLREYHAQSMKPLRPEPTEHFAQRKLKSTCERPARSAGAPSAGSSGAVACTMVSPVDRTGSVCSSEYRALPRLMTQTRPDCSRENVSESSVRWRRSSLPSAWVRGTRGVDDLGLGVRRLLALRETHDKSHRRSRMISYSGVNHNTVLRGDLDHAIQVVHAFAKDRFDMISILGSERISAIFALEQQGDWSSLERRHSRVEKCCED